MSGYLDDNNQGVTVSNSSLLLAQLQQQGYSRRISPTGRSRQRGVAAAGPYDDIDEEVDDDGLSVTTWDSQEEDRKAQEEWEESMKQLNLAIQVMILPFFGKWLGRKWSYWGRFHDIEVNIIGNSEHY